MKTIWSLLRGWVARRRGASPPASHAGRVSWRGTPVREGNSAAARESFRTIRPTDLGLSRTE